MPTGNGSVPNETSSGPPLQASFRGVIASGAVVGSNSAIYHSTTYNASSIGSWNVPDFSQVLPPESIPYLHTRINEWLPPRINRTQGYLLLWNELSPVFRLSEQLLERSQCNHNLQPFPTHSTHPQQQPGITDRPAFINYYRRLRNNHSQTIFNIWNWISHLLSEFSFQGCNLAEEDQPSEVLTNFKDQVLALFSVLLQLYSVYNSLHCIISTAESLNLDLTSSAHHCFRTLNDQFDDVVPVPLERCDSIPDIISYLHIIQTCILYSPNTIPNPKLHITSDEDGRYVTEEILESFRNGVQEFLYVSVQLPDATRVCPNCGASIDEDHRRCNEPCRSTFIFGEDDTPEGNPTQPVTDQDAQIIAAARRGETKIIKRWYVLLPPRLSEWIPEPPESEEGYWWKFQEQREREGRNRTLRRWERVEERWRRDRQEGQGQREEQEEEEEEEQDPQELHSSSENPEWWWAQLRQERDQRARERQERQEQWEQRHHYVYRASTSSSTSSGGGFAGNASRSMVFWLSSVPGPQK